MTAIKTLDQVVSTPGGVQSVVDTPAVIPAKIDQAPAVVDPGLPPAGAPENAAPAHSSLKIKAPTPPKVTSKKLDAEVLARAKFTPPAEEAPQGKLTKLTGQKGSNPGGIYQDEAGKKFYVKFPRPQYQPNGTNTDGKDHLRDEYLATLAYQVAEVPITSKYFLEVDGAWGMVSPILDLEMFKGTGQAAIKAFRASADVMDNFIMDVWVANWDVLGLGYDNVGREKVTTDESGNTPEGRLVRIDPGGCLRFRAQGVMMSREGQPKLSAEAREVDTLRNQQVNPEAAPVFKDLTDDQIKVQVKRLVKTFTDKVITELVARSAEVSGLDPQGVEELTAKLIARKQYLKDRFLT